MYNANLVVALLLPLPYSDAVTRRFQAWKRSGVGLISPLLLEYEVVSVLRKAVVAGLLTADLAAEALEDILALGIVCIAPTPALHRHALQWAGRLGQAKAYDAHYLALAEQEQSELWTADRRLAHSAQQAGASWAVWIGDSGDERGF